MISEEKNLRFHRPLVACLSVLLSTVFALILAEISVRIIDDYPLTKLSLRPALQTFATELTADDSQMMKMLLQSLNIDEKI